MLEKLKQDDEAKKLKQLKKRKIDSFSEASDETQQVLQFKRMYSRQRHQEVQKVSQSLGISIANSKEHVILMY